jgi:hypothetical protein
MPILVMKNLFAKPEQNAYSKRLPTPIIRISLQASSNCTRNPMIQPNLPIQLIISLLIQEKLMMSSERRIRFPMFIEIRRMHPRSILTIEEDDHAFANIDEKTYCTAASVGRIMLATPN